MDENIWVNDVDGFNVTVISRQIGGSAGRWVIRVQVHDDYDRPWVPDREDADNSYASLNDARAAGLALGKEMIASVRG